MDEAAIGVAQREGVRGEVVGRQPLEQDRRRVPPAASRPWWTSPKRDAPDETSAPLDDMVLRRIGPVSSESRSGGSSTPDIPMLYNTIRYPLPRGVGKKSRKVSIICIQDE
jgi:hypothetical protein